MVHSTDILFTYIINPNHTVSVCELWRTHPNFHAFSSINNLETWSNTPNATEVNPLGVASGTQRIPWEIPCDFSTESYQIFPEKLRGISDHPFIDHFPIDNLPTDMSE